MRDEYHYEQYAEEQFERTANGLEEETFAEWRKRRQAIRQAIRTREDFRRRRAAMIDNSMFGNPYNHSR